VDEIGGAYSKREGMRNAYKHLAEKPIRKRPYGIYRKLILKWVLNKRGLRSWTGFTWL
jgi:hypothetical protein